MIGVQALHQVFKNRKLELHRDGWNGWYNWEEVKRGIVAFYLLDLCEGNDFEVRRRT